VVLLRNYLDESPLAIFATVWLASTIPQALLWLRQDSGFFLTQGILGILGAIVPVIFWLTAKERRTAQSEVVT
jgi:hypothetical protein